MILHLDGVKQLDRANFSLRLNITPFYSVITPLTCGLLLGCVHECVCVCAAAQFTRISRRQPCTQLGQKCILELLVLTDFCNISHLRIYHFKTAMAQSLMVFHQTTVEGFPSVYFLVFGLFIIFTQ